MSVRGVAVRPGEEGSAALLELPEPPPGEGGVLVRALAWGICGTDREVVAGEYGAAPPGAAHLVLGHESLGEVIDAPAGSGLAPGDRVVAIVAVGSVNANRSHYRMAADALAAADRGWLDRLVTRREPLDAWRSALTAQPDDVKVVVTFA